MSALITRTLTEYTVSAYTLDVDGDGNPVSYKLAEVTVHDTSMSERHARSLVLTQVAHMERLPKDCRIVVKKGARKVLAMDLGTFIKHARVIAE